MKQILMFLLLLFSINKISAQETELTIGQQAPSITFNKCLDKPLSAGFYKNKILIIDFWATWCAPCIASFPHFNALSDKFKSDKVLFATITDEPELTALTFFKRSQKRVDALRLIDTSRVTSKVYGANSIPFCVVIDQNNRVRWTGNTANLTEQKLKEIIENPNVTIVEAAKKIVPAFALKASPRPVTYLKFAAIKGNDTLASSGSWAGGAESDFYSIDRNNIKLGNLLGELTGFSSIARFITNDTLKFKQTVSVSFNSPYGSGNEKFATDYAGKFIPKAPRTNYLISQLEYAFNFKFLMVEKSAPVYELVILDHQKLNSFKSLQKGHASFSDDYFPKFEIVGYKLKGISRELENSFKKIIVNNIVDDANYDLSLDISSLKKLNETLAFHGLQLRETITMVKMIELKFN